METPKGFEDLLVRYNIELGSATALRIAGFRRLLAKWNRRINLTSTTEWPALKGLFEESLWAAALYPDEATAHLDIGSGAGFPALLIRILRPRMALEMIEVRAKRAAFLETVIGELGLTNCVVHQCRLEEHLERSGALSCECISWKGLKLSRRVLDTLIGATPESAEFWLFHGSRLPVQDGAVLERLLRLERRETFPGRRDSFLSIYKRRPSCFT